MSSKSQPPPQAQFATTGWMIAPTNTPQIMKLTQRPAFGDGAGEDRRRRVHEHHLEQEEDGDADIKDVGGEEEALVPEEPVVRAGDA